MLKFLVLGTLLWLEISCQGTDTEPVTLPPFNVRTTNYNSSQCSCLPDNKENGVVLETHQTFHFNFPPELFQQRSTGCSDVETKVKPAIRPDYTLTAGIGAHKVYASQLSWNRARQTCLSEGGQLAIIRSAEEQNVIQNLMRNQAVEDAWLGLHDLYEEGDWVSVLGESIGQTGWARWSPLIKPNPDNFHGKQHCARLLRDGNGMDDLECSAGRPFVCKISIT